VLDVNLTGAFLMIQSVGRVMRSQGSGVIISLVSESTRDEKGEAAFVASMAGLGAFTRQAARELNPYAIQVYMVENNGEKTADEVLALLEER